MSFSELSAAPPLIGKVEIFPSGGSAAAVAGEPEAVKAGISASQPLIFVNLYHRGVPDAPFRRVELKDDGASEDGAAEDGVFGALIPAYPAGSRVEF